jgi:hypothetical protein
MRRAALANESPRHLGCHHKEEKNMRKLIVLAGTIALLGALAFPAAGIAGKPIISEHDNFTSDPYPDGWCGIAGTSVDVVHDQYREDASGASIENVNITTYFTAASSGKSMTIQSSGVHQQNTPTDNGDGTFTFILANSGIGPKFTFADGTRLLDRGTIGFALTVDSNDEFVSFDVLYQHGQRPPGCDTIIAELS